MLCSEILTNKNSYFPDNGRHSYVIETFLNDLYDSVNFSDYGPNGLQVEGNRPIRKIVTAVSASLETIEAAAKRSADALVVHHGLFWQGQKQVLTGALFKRVQKILDAGISLYAYHLPMDGHLELGNSAQIARQLNLQNIEPSFYYKGNALGVLGDLKENLDLDEFQNHCIDLFNKKPVLFGRGREKLKRIAIVSGGGQREFSSAIDSPEIDLFLTGEMSEQNYHEAKENGKWFMAAGHHATEIFGPRALADFLSGFGLFDKVEFLDLPNPI